MAYIYLITNKINGKQYVGKTENTIDERWKEHKQDYKKERCEKRPLYDAMLKYGIDNFEIKELEYLKEGGKLLSDREIYWIEKLKTFHNGYNATKGGDGSILYDREKVLELIKLGYTCNQIIEKIGCSKDWLHNLANLHNLHLRNSRSQIIGQYDAEGNLLNTFFGAYEAQKWLISNNITQNTSVKQHIRECCQGKRKTCLKYIWKFLPDPK